MWCFIGIGMHTHISAQALSDISPHMNAVCLNDVHEYEEEGVKEGDILTFVAVGGGSGGRSTFIYTHRLDFERALNSFQATCCLDDDLVK